MSLSRLSDTRSLNAIFSPTDFCVNDKYLLRKVKTTMMLKDEKQAIIEQYATHEGDTGSPEVQIALLTYRIKNLTEHLKLYCT